MLRYIIAVPFIFVGIWLFIAAPMAGYGVHLGPDPTMGTVIAFSAAVTILIGYGILAMGGDGRTAEKIISVVFLLSSAHLIVAVFLLVHDRIYHVTAREAGHLDAATAQFGISYGLLSLICLVVLRLLSHRFSVRARS